MKIRLFTLSAFCLLSTLSWAQTLLYNDGATIKIQAGATLYVEGDVTNTSMGTFDNDGTLDIKGNFTNSGMWEASQPNTLKFSGNIPSAVTSAVGVVYQDVVIAKTSPGVVNLSSDMTINDSLVFSSPGVGQLTLGAFNLNMGANAKAGGYDTDEYVVTNGAGAMKKPLTPTASFEFPIGFTTTPATYNPATVNATAGPAETYSARVLGSPGVNGLTGAAITTDVVDAVWDIQEATAGGNTYDLTLGWQETDELVGFNDALNAVSRYDGTNGWDALHSQLGPEVSNTRTRTGLTDFGAFAVGDKTVSNTLYVNAKVFLQGPYVNAAGMMHDSLRVLSYIPLTEPYSTFPTNPYSHVAYGGGEAVTSASVFDQPANGDDIVDWVVIELRSLTDSLTRVATKTALIQRDGDLVDLTGTGPVAIHGVADGSYILGIRHRNHLGIRTNTSYSLSNTVGSLADLTVLGNVYDDPAIVSPTSPMRLLTGSIYGLWTGDVNSSQHIVYNGTGSDRALMLLLVGPATPTVPFPGYKREDINMSGKTIYNGTGSDRAIMLLNVGPTTPTIPMNSHNNN